MKYIGIVAGAKPEQATALKAALIAKDPLVKVVIEETAMRQDAPDERVKLADRKIELFNAVEALAAKGVRIAAFTCACPANSLCTTMQRPAAVVKPVFCSPTFQRGSPIRRFVV